MSCICFFDIEITLSLIEKKVRSFILLSCKRKLRCFSCSFVSWIGAGFAYAGKNKSGCKERYLCAKNENLVHSLTSCWRGLYYPVYAQCESLLHEQKYNSLGVWKKIIHCVCLFSISPDRDGKSFVTINKYILKG